MRHDRCPECRRRTWVARRAEAACLNCKTRWNLLTGKVLEVAS